MSRVCLFLWLVCCDLASDASCGFPEKNSERQQQNDNSVDVDTQVSFVILDSLSTQLHHGWTAVVCDPHV